MESRSLADGGPRVKFSLTRRGTIADYFHGSSASSKFHLAAAQLADALTILAESGATPILTDGKIAGNGSVQIVTGNQEHHLLVSKSGKTAGEEINPEKDTCIVSRFDPKTWSAEYYSSCESVLPTSDTPLHYSILHLLKAYDQSTWSEVPTATLHGHSLDSLEDAQHLGLPCSMEETMFSTPDDLRALLDVVGRNPYPQNKIYIRRGHGFFILGKDIPDALHTFRTVVEPYLKAKKTHELNESV